MGTGKQRVSKNILASFILLLPFEAEHSTVVAAVCMDSEQSKTKDRGSGKRVSQELCEEGGISCAHLASFIDMH